MKLEFKMNPVWVVVFVIVVLIIAVSWWLGIDYNSLLGK